MPSEYQRENLEAMLGLFLEAQGHPLPQHSKFKSASALSRFPDILHLHCTAHQAHQGLKPLADNPRPIREDWKRISVIVR